MPHERIIRFDFESNSEREIENPAKKDFYIKYGTLLKT